jgi:hypothetical protein
MSTSLLNPTIITRKALLAFVNNLVFAKGANRQYDNQFANTGASTSGKIGPTLTIRKPNRFTITSGAALQVQDITEESTTFTPSTRYHVGFTFPTVDLTLTIDDFMERYVNRAVETLSNQVDYDGLTLAYQTVANSVGETSSVLPPASAKPYLYANAKLNELATPQSGRRYVVINPVAQAATVNGLTTLLNPAGTISKQFEKGAMGDALGFTFKMDQNVNSHTCGTRAASSESTMGTTATAGDTTFDIDTGSGVTFKKGDVFTVADCYAVNPQSKQSTGSLRQFVVTADYAATGTTAAALPIWPAPYASGAKQNVNALPTSAKAIVFVGVASTVYPQNIAYWQDAFSLVTCDLEIPQGVHFAGRENYEGVSLRIVRQYSIDSDQIPCRIDVLYGWKELYPDAACRIWGPLS